MRAPIDDFVGALERRLAGPARLKADMLTEARDSLIDAAQAHAAGGMSEHEAQALAVTEFGAPAELAPAYQLELAAGAGRRLALLIALIPLVASSLATLTWWHAPWAATAPSAGYQAMADVVDWLAYGLAGLGLAGYLALTAGARRWPAGRRGLRTIALVGAGAVTVNALAGVAITAWTVEQWGVGTLDWPPMMIGVIALIPLYGWITHHIRTCLLATAGSEGG